MTRRRTVQEDRALRLDGGVRRGRRITIFFDDRPVAAYVGESVAAALVAAGHPAFRRTARRGEPRGLFCGMGLCYDCLAEIDGQPGRRACMTPVREGMRVRLQDGWGDAVGSESAGTPSSRCGS